MFLVFSKEKIFTYLVSILTVTLLFVGVANFQVKSGDTIETSAKEGKLLPIYKVKTVATTDYDRAGTGPMSSLSTS